MPISYPLQPQSSSTTPKHAPKTLAEETLDNDANLHNESLMPLEQARLFQYSRAIGRIKVLIKDFEEHVEAPARLRRATRFIDVDIKKLQAAGELGADETMISIRVIDDNIRKEKPPFLAFLKQSRRMVIFTDMDEPNDRRASELLEKDYTQGMSYLRWNVPFEKALDGAQLHGWDWIETEFDSKKPFMVGFSHIGHENLIFDIKARDIQSQEELLRKFTLSVYEFERLQSRKGFNSNLIRKVVAKKRESNENIDDEIIIYKRFFKYDGIVYVNWLADPKECTDYEEWLREPEKLFLGKVTTEMSIDENLRPVQLMFPIDEEEYPIEGYYYQETEEAMIVKKRGRYDLDKEKQEAQTALWSVYINGCIRASNVYASPKNATGESVPRILDLDLVAGTLYSVPLEFWSPPYPNDVILRASNALDVKMAAEQGETSYAVLNRKDSRKTAEEISTAQEKEVAINSITLGNFSNFVTASHGRAWPIVQSLGMIGVVPILKTTDPMSGEKINNIELLGREYNVRAAGDVDVLERNEKLKKRFAVWPMVQQTGISQMFLVDILKEMFPEDSFKYEQLLLLENQKDKIIQILGEIVKAALVGPDGNIRPEFAGMEPQLEQIAQFIGQGQQQQAQLQQQTGA
jgi:hypothetical protein